MKRNFSLFLIFASAFMTSPILRAHGIMHNLAFTSPLHTSCPPGQAPIPDSLPNCGRILNVYSGYQILGLCGANLNNLERCYSALAPLTNCYSGTLTHGTCIEGYNCPTDQYPSHMCASPHCNNKTHSLTDPRCVPTGQLTSWDCQ